MPQRAITTKPPIALIKRQITIPKSLVIGPKMPVVSTRNINRHLVAYRSPQIKTRNVGKGGGKKSVKVTYSSPEIDAASKARIYKLHGVGRNKVLVILGNGPSLIEINDLAQLKGVHGVDTMSINKPDRRVWPTTYWLFCDKTQQQRHMELWDSYTGTIITSAAVRASKPNVVQVRHIGGGGFSRDLSTGFHIGRSSVHAAMQVAFWMQYDHVYILGVDMCAIKVDGKEMVWAYGLNPDVKPKNRVDRFANEAVHYAKAAELLSQAERDKYSFCSDHLKFAFASKFKKKSHLGIVNCILKHAEELSSNGKQASQQQEG